MRARLVLEAIAWNGAGAALLALSASRVASAHAGPRIDAISLAMWAASVVLLVSAWRRTVRLATAAGLGVAPSRLRRPSLRLARAREGTAVAAQVAFLDHVVGRAPREQMPWAVGTAEERLDWLERRDDFGSSLRRGQAMMVVVGLSLGVSLGPALQAFGLPAAWFAPSLTFPLIAVLGAGAWSTAEGSARWYREHVGVPAALASA